MNNLQKNYLLIDNSNSRTKIMRVVDGYAKGELHVCPTADLSEPLLKELFADEEYSLAVISSVVPKCKVIFDAALECDVHYVTHLSPMEMDFDYSGVNTLGADRVVNALAATTLTPLPCIAVDAGTATTFDVVVQRDGKPVFIGGVIAPGLSAFTGYLHEKTACLPDIKCIEHSPNAVGKDTMGAMQAGAVYGFSGMCDGIIRRIEEQLGSRCAILVTGGDAELLRSKLNRDCILERNLTFIGLRKIAENLL